ncbi:MAG: hypothetical protein GY720_03530 [bacterium]|nr:hypothetical protein [bacterium]
MTGHITRSNKEHVPVGMPVWFRVVTGEDAEPDVMTWLIYESDSPDQWPTDCHDETAPLFADLLFPLISGWMKVRG